MRANHIRELWALKKPVINGWLLMPGSLSAELMAHSGFDSLTIDMQHGMIEFDSALAMLTAISTTSVTPIVRVPWLDAGPIMKMLDAGAYGIICPMVNSRNQAEALVSATHYAPTGSRSWGPVRAMLYAGNDYREKADETILNFAMIETAEAVRNIDEICSVKGLDAIYIGPGDLSLSLTGSVRPDTLDGAIGDAIRLILATAKKHGVAPCTHTSSPQFALQMLELGFQFVTCAIDARLLGAAAAAATAVMRAPKETR
jgi:4-hydroxy-2-oxoheptanedioate aldolase